MSINSFAIRLPFGKVNFKKTKLKFLFVKVLSEKLHFYFTKTKFFLCWIDFKSKKNYRVLSFLSNSGERILVKPITWSYRTRIIERLICRTDISKSFVRIDFICLLFFAVNIGVRMCDDENSDSQSIYSFLIAEFQLNFKSYRRNDENFWQKHVQTDILLFRGRCHPERIAISFWSAIGR